MPDPTPPVAAERPPEPLVYRPVSGLAIAGLACAALYAGLLLLSVVIAFLKQEPFYLGSWLLALPVAGGILSVLALRQIRTSEGTRAGGGLARCGLWLAVFAGLGSATFSTFTGLAIRHQAERFMLEKGPGSGFFPLLLEGDTNQAFLLTMPPARRQANPHNEKEMEKFYDLPEGKPESADVGPLSQFRETDFVRVLQQPYDKPTRVQALGVRSWEYEAKGYKVERIYRVSTLEGEFDLPVAVQSFDSEVPGEGRKWMVVRHPSMRLHPVQLTELGRKMTELRHSAELFVKMSLMRLHRSHVFDFYLDTLPPSERSGWRRCAVGQMFGLGICASGSPPGALGFVSLPAPCISFLFAPALPSLATGKSPLVLDRLRVRGPADLDARIRRVTPYLATNATPYLGSEPKVNENAVKFAHWQKKDGRLEVSIDIAFGLNLRDGKFPQGVMVTGRAVVSADATAEAKEGDDPTRLWRLERIELDRALPMLGPGPGPQAPPGGGGAG
jgi:hypothetical protein